MKDKRIGLVLSYILIAVDVVVGLVFTPTLIRLLGSDEYGLYRVIASVASYLAVLDFGIGSTITRYVIKYNTENDRQSAENFCAIGLLIYAFLGLVVLLIGCVLCVFLKNIFPSSITQDNLNEARLILVLLSLNTVATLITHAITGLLNAYRKFIFINFINILKLVLRAVIIICVIYFIRSSIVIAAVEFIISSLVLFASWIYKNHSIPLKIRLHQWNWLLIREIFVFTSAVFVQAIISQFNGNLDNILIGALVSASAVAVYTIALQLFTMYSSFSTAVMTIATPGIMQDVFTGDDNQRIIDALVPPSRMQLFVVSLVYTGFVFWGRNFIVLWVNQSYVTAYYVGLLLFTSAFIDLIQNNFYSVLKAKNKLHGRTLILVGATVINFILTIYLLPRYGIIGAAMGTAASYILGNTIALNLYYRYWLQLDVKRFFFGVFQRIPLMLLCACGSAFLVRLLLPSNTWLTIIISIGVYTIVFGVLCYLLGLLPAERRMADKVLGQFLRKIPFISRRTL